MQININATKYFSAYTKFIENKAPFIFSREFSITNFMFISSIKNAFNSIKKIHENENKSDFFMIVANLLNLDFNLNQNAIEEFHIKTLLNCAKYENFDIKNDHKCKSFQNINRQFNEELTLIEIQDKIEELPDDDFKQIEQNIINVYGDYDVFQINFISNLFKKVLSHNGCNKMFECLNQRNFDLSNLYQFDFQKLNSGNDQLDSIFDNIKYVYFPLTVYTYDSDVLYVMNKKLLELYGSLEQDYFDNEYVKLSFIIVHCLTLVKKYFCSENNVCNYIANNTIGKWSQNQHSPFVYRGVFVNSKNIDETRTSYQVKTNSFSKSPDGAKIVLEFYHNKFNLAINKDLYDTIILYIAKNNDNFIPIQFFNPDIAVSQQEEEVVHLPFVKYECTLICDYNCNTCETVLNTNNILDLAIITSHNNFFKEISETQYNLKIYYIDNIQSLVNFV